jgi:hypothetical protein
MPLLEASRPLMSYLTHTIRQPLTQRILKQISRIPSRFVQECLKQSLKYFSWLANQGVGRINTPQYRSIYYKNPSTGNRQAIINAQLFD